MVTQGTTARERMMRSYTTIFSRTIESLDHCKLYNEDHPVSYLTKYIKYTRNFNVNISKNKQKYYNKINNAKNNNFVNSQQGKHLIGKHIHNVLNRSLHLSKYQHLP